MKERARETRYAYEKLTTELYMESRSAMVKRHVNYSSNGYQCDNE